MSIFNLDSPVMKFLTLVADIMIVGFFWLLTSLLIVTIGASTSAAYYVLMRRISNQERSIVKDFFHSFKENIKISSILFLMLAVLSLLNLYNILFSQIVGMIGLVIFGLQIIVAIELIFLQIYVYPLISRFDFKFMQIIKTALFMAHKHLFTSITHIILFAAVALLCYTFPMLTLVAFGLYCTASSYMLIKVFRKYNPDMDKNPDLENEN